MVHGAMGYNYSTSLKWCVALKVLSFLHTIPSKYKFLTEHASEQGNVIRLVSIFFLCVYKKNCN